MVLDMTERADATVLVVNAGSGSLKLSVLGDGDQTLDERTIESAPDSEEATGELQDVLAGDISIDAVGIRVVHGGAELTDHCVIDDSVMHALRSAADLAPLHVPPTLATIETCRAQLPDLPHVACIDTAFHAGLPPAAHTYPIPAAWRQRYGLRRYGFHGLSYAWALGRAAELLHRPVNKLSVVLAHLGGGASVCAVNSGVSQWCSMGFTPLEGVPMMTRSGSVDPWMLLWLQTSAGLTADEISDGLEHHSGLIGLSGGLSGDTRELVAAAANGNQHAELALAVYTLRVRQEIAAAAACLPRLDAVVFTGEIGADQPEIRESVTSGLTVLGLAGDLNPEQDQDAVVSGPTARVPVLLVHPREDRQIAAETRKLVAEDSS
jgi:acetate kinase